ncbi:beta-glucuronosyltransferase GlcAT14B-like [Magnolia sinica]|uniref:beta-glucuronosyltransferase GlcAT14B-like n=1 Tax=Magnolia sinica TaxID=86752 RepID=UPI00265A9C0A|nr:beta-glucuronosyltransferase GlcAT14B-like [Magnolia sinica]
MGHPVFVEVGNVRMIMRVNLVTQDDLLYMFSSILRDLNFIDHTSDIGWKEFQRAKPIIIDPGLYMSKKADVFWITQRRSICIQTIYRCRMQSCH